MEIENIPLSYKALLSLFAFICLLSCKPDKPAEFQLPNHVNLDSYGFYDIFNIDQIIDPPFKNTDSWNDSLLKLCRIHKITFKRSGIKNPENLAEKIQFNFTEHGKLKSYDYRNLELSSLNKTFINLDKSGENKVSYKVVEYFGKKSNLYIENEFYPELSIFRRISEDRIKEENRSIYHNNKLIAKIEKHGDFITKIQFIQDVSLPIKNLEKSLTELHLSYEEFLLAEKIVTFTENGLPQKSYLMDENFIKGNLCQEWIYQGRNQLTGYKKYVNGSCVKDLKFDYSKDKILKTLTVDHNVYALFYKDRKSVV